MNFQAILLTMIIAAIGGLVFVKLKVPAGALLGAMLFVSLFNIISGGVFFPMQARPYVRILAGALIGSRMKKSDLIQMKTLAYPAVLLVFGMLLLNLSLGYSIHLLTGLELTTALFGSAPGGVQDMALIAEDFGANISQITVLQTARIFSIVGIMPTLLRTINKKYTHPSGEVITSAGTSLTPSDINNIKTEADSPGSADFIRTLAFAACGGLLLNITDIPAASMIGAMFATVLATVLVKPSFIPKKTRIVTQIFSGALLGSRVGLKEILSLKEIIVPAMIMVLMLLVANLVFGYIIHKLTKLDLTTSLFASAAGGASDMALVADEIGADTPKIAIMQLLRLICVVSLFPTIFRLLN